MSFLIKDNELLVIYNEICDKVTNTIKKGKTCVQQKYLKTKIDLMEEKSIQSKVS